MTILRGATLVFCDGKPINASVGLGSEPFAWLGGGYLLGIPIPVYLMALVYAISWYVLTQTRFGRYIYALGGNEEAPGSLVCRQGSLKQWSTGSAAPWPPWLE